MVFPLCLCVFPNLFLYRHWSCWFGAYPNDLILIISLKALPPNIVLFWGTGVWDFNRWILKRHSSAHNKCWVLAVARWLPLMRLFAVPAPLNQRRGNDKEKDNIILGAWILFSYLHHLRLNARPWPIPLTGDTMCALETGHLPLSHLEGGCLHKIGFQVKWNGREEVLYVTNTAQCSLQRSSNFLWQAIESIESFWARLWQYVPGTFHIPAMLVSILQ